MADLSSLPDPAQPSTTPQQATNDPAAAVDPINAIGTDPFAAPDTEPQQDPFSVPEDDLPTPTQEATQYMPVTPDYVETAGTSYDDGVSAAPQPVYAQPSQPLYTPTQEHEFTIYDLPDQFRPMSPWGYVGHAILYSIPVVGLVFLLIHTFSKKNYNRRNFARSYWIWLLISIIVIAVLVIAGVIGPDVYQPVENAVRGTIDSARSAA